jgi:hypothetical protein
MCVKKAERREALEPEEEGRNMALQARICGGMQLRRNES